MGESAGQQPGYAARLRAAGSGSGGGSGGAALLEDAAWVGGLSTALACCWRGLAAHPMVQAVAAGYLVAELAFYVVGKFRRRHVSRLCEPPGDTARLQVLFQRFLQLRDVFSLDDFLSGWFLGAPPSAILRGNLEDFVSYGFYCKLLCELAEQEQDTVRRFVDDVEAAWGVRFAPGFDPTLQYMAHLWEPLRAYHKPLAMFAATELFARVAHVLMRLMGFRPARAGRFSYWHAPALAPAPPLLPGEALSPPMSPMAGSSRRHSTSEAVGAAVHHAAEHALDATLIVTSVAAAAVAVQFPHPHHPHPHDAPPPLSPRTRSPAGVRPSSPLPPRPASPLPPRPASPAVRRRGDSALQCSGSAGSMTVAISGAAGGSADQQQQQQQAQQRQGPPTAEDSAGSLDGGSPGSSSGGTRPDIPIVFLHGVGFGVLPYLHMIRDIQHACPNTPLVLVEVPHVALRLCWEAQPVDGVAQAVAELLGRHGYRRACIVGHSYGTFVASRLCQLHPELVHSVCLLDPVAMLTCYPKLLYNFIYKSPTIENFTTAVGAVDLLRFLCSRDLTIAQAICRLFHWSELQLWPQDLPRRALVVLSGEDDLVPSQLVLAQLKTSGHPATVMHHPDLGHGGILLAPEYMAEFVARLRAMLAR